MTSMAALAALQSQMAAASRAERSCRGYDMISEINMIQQRFSRRHMEQQQAGSATQAVAHGHDS